MNIDIDGLIELAKKATPGPWHKKGYSTIIARSGRSIARASLPSKSWVDEMTANATFIANANPTVILALCERLREAEKTIQNALSELKAGDVRSAIDQLEAGNE
ncbi:ead/Ea22-like family protein [Pseudomonas luteola]|uniref:Ead/Ea22-like family protein n=1 Tax=Pseudomonas luteola TaxID=47886 RepID=A0ABS0MV63_PSELU|nr:ead/Ea22-like family protein [Pseudomonas luteola]MBH3440486.1 ead/Ea22-like family protein [Pseudomonas luteola]